MKLKRYIGHQRLVRRGTITAADIRKKFNLPEHAEITMTVPSGADWSGMTITLGEDFPALDVRVEDVCYERR